VTDPVDTGTGEFVYAPPEEEVIAEQVALIGAEGGTIELEGAGSIEIPAGAVSAEVEITARAVTAAPDPAQPDIVLIGPVFETNLHELGLAEAAILTIEMHVDDLQRHFGEFEEMPEIQFFEMLSPASLWVDSDSTLEFVPGEDEDVEEDQNKHSHTRTFSGGRFQVIARANAFRGTSGYRPDSQCGNGILDPGEQCDAYVFEPCTRNGHPGLRQCRVTFEGGGPASHCRFSYDCIETNHSCGDGWRQPWEVCDSTTTCDPVAAGPLRPMMPKGKASACRVWGINVGSEDVWHNGEIWCAGPAVAYERVGGCRDDCTAKDSCRVVERCGDGIINGGAVLDSWELCRGGSCRYADCADATGPCVGVGDVWGREECDDGNTNDFDGCSRFCTIEHFTCGNGIVEDTEGCDAGAANGSSICGCQTNCQYPRGITCGSGAVSGPCDIPDVCDGTGACAATWAPAGTRCAEADGSACDAPDVCNGSGHCTATFRAAGTQCQAANGVCDPADSCDAYGNCVANFAPATTECRADEGQCNPADFCDGAGSCREIFKPDTTECRASTSLCDSAEFLRRRRCLPGRRRIRGRRVRSVSSVPSRRLH